MKEIEIKEIEMKDMTPEMFKNSKRAYKITFGQFMDWYGTEPGTGESCYDSFEENCEDTLQDILFCSGIEDDDEMWEAIDYLKTQYDQKVTLIYDGIDERSLTHEYTMIVSINGKMTKLFFSAMEKFTNK